MPAGFSMNSLAIEMAGTYSLCVNSKVGHLIRNMQEKRGAKKKRAPGQAENGRGDERRRKCRGIWRSQGARNFLFLRADALARDRVRGGSSGRHLACLAPSALPLPCLPLSNPLPPLSHPIHSIHPCSTTASKIHLTNDRRIGIISAPSIKPLQFGGFFRDGPRTCRA